MGEARASAAHRWVPCTGSLSMERPFPDDPHEVAKQGTAAHWVGATCLTDPSRSPASMLGLTHENGIPVDGDMVEHVEEYLQEVRSIATVDHLYVEREMDMTWLHPELGGTPDAWYYCFATGTLYLWDFKYGWRPVDPFENWQMVEYLAGIIGFLGNVPIKRIEAVTVQPRPSHYDGRIRRWHTTPAELGPLFTKLQEKATEATGNSPLCVTGPHCRDCRALAYCPHADAAALAAIEVSGRVAHVTPTPETMASEMNILTAAAEAIKLRLAAIETVATGTIESGGMIPGYARERSYGRKKWKNEEELRAVEVMTGLSLFEDKPISPPRAKKAGMDAVTLALYSTTPETGAKLVKRDLSKKAAEVFGAKGEQ